VRRYWLVMERGGGVLGRSRRRRKLTTSIGIGSLLSRARTSILLLIADEGLDTRQGQTTNPIIEPENANTPQSPRVNEQTRIERVTTL
jgi:hypothetical protein